MQSNIVASGGLGGEVFIWDLDAALAPVAKSVDAKEDEVPNGNSGPALTTLCNVNSSSNIASSNGQAHGYNPITAKGHKDSVYALAMNDTGTLLVSGGTEKVLHSSSLETSMEFFCDEETSQLSVSVNFFPLLRTYPVFIFLCRLFECGIPGQVQKR